MIGGRGCGKGQGGRGPPPDGRGPPEGMGGQGGQGGRGGTEQSEFEGPPSEFEGRQSKSVNIRILVENDLSIKIM